MADTRLLQELRQRMASEIVHFRYMKAQGELRDAWGTTCPDFYDYTFRGTAPADRPGLTTYWDFRRKMWRCFRNERLAEVLS